MVSKFYTAQVCLLWESGSNVAIYGTRARSWCKWLPAYETSEIWNPKKNENSEKTLLTLEAGSPYKPLIERGRRAAGAKEFALVK